MEQEQEYLPYFYAWVRVEEVLATGVRVYFEEPLLAVVYAEEEEHFIGCMAEGTKKLGLVFPKQTTQIVCEEMLEFLLKNEIITNKYPERVIGEILATNLDKFKVVALI